MAPVTAIIPNWNRARLLDRVLADLRGQTHSPHRIVVVDGGSTDESNSVAVRHGAEFTILPDNPGFATAVNRGLALTTTPLAAILNNDIELEPDYIEHLAGSLEQFPEAWFASGKIYRAGEKSTILDGSFDAISRGGCSWRCGHGQPDGPWFSAPRSIEMAPFTALLARRDLFAKVGMLDERFQSYLEDADFGLRCARAGLGGRFVPTAVGRHWGSATLGAWKPETVRLIARNQLFLVAKHFPDDWLHRFGWPIVAGQLLWGLLAARHGTGCAYVRGKWEGIRRFRALRPTGLPMASRQELGVFLNASESLIRELQGSPKQDWYWRAYFALV